MSRLDVVVTRLRKLVGDRHPDVAALGQQCATASLRRFGPLTGPPMFQAGLEAAGGGGAAARGLDSRGDVAAWWRRPPCRR